MKPRVFIPDPIADCGIKRLEPQCACLTPWRDGAPPDAKAAQSLLYSADAVIVRLFSISASDLDQCTQLKVIAKHGVGVDNIDCRAATARRIPVLYTPEANSNAVAEHAVGLMLALARQVAPASLATREGRFNERGRFQGVELAGKILGVAGLGRVGARVAQIAAHGLAMNVLAHDPVIDPNDYAGPATPVGTFAELLPRCDFLTLHVPLTSQTKHLIDDHALSAMKSTCRIINTSRGAVVDETALVRALTDQQIGGAALDVFEAEPLPANHPLCNTPNTLLTPHISSSTDESLDRMADTAARGVLDVLNGRAPKYIVNPESRK